MAKRMGKIIITGMVTALLCAGLLFLSSLIPQRAVEDKCYESAVYFTQHVLFEETMPGFFFSKQDNYADCILTQIIWQMDEKDPVRSSLEAAYYSNEDEPINTSFLKALEEGILPNTEYVRYWHGSMVILRPLFCIFNITQIRIILAVAAGAELLAAGILYVSVLNTEKRKNISPTAVGICFALALVLVHAYLIALSVEYVTTFLVLGAVLLLLLHGLGKDPDMHTESLFVISGIVTCFVDFLTTETITFTVPMVFLLLILYENDRLSSIKEGIRRIFTNGICWLSGYAGMFAAKWGISALVFGKETLVGSLTHAAERVGGTVQDDTLTVSLTKSQQYLGAIWENLGCLFPFRYTMEGGKVFLWTFILLLVVAALFYLFRTNEKHGVLFVPLLLLALLPYVRYLALSNHACRHYFFTYRAQLVSVFVLLLFITMDILPGMRRQAKR